MEEKKVLNENELENVAGGSEGEATQIHIGPGNSYELYRCTCCGTLDFYIIGSGPNYVQVRCKNCGTVSRVTQD